MAERATHEKNWPLTAGGIILIALALRIVFAWQTQNQPSTVIERSRPTVVRSHGSKTTTHNGAKTTITRTPGVPRPGDSVLVAMLGLGLVMAVAGQLYGRIQSIGPSGVTFSSLPAVGESVEKRMKAMEDAMSLANSSVKEVRENDAKLAAADADLASRIKLLSEQQLEVVTSLLNHLQDSSHQRQVGEHGGSE